MEKKKNQMAEDTGQFLPYDSLSPQAKAQHELAIIQKFLAGCFEGEYMFEKDKNIIASFTSLKGDDEKQTMLENLEKVAYTYN